MDEIVVFDLETTGLSALGGDRICEIGAVKIREFEVVDKFWSLVNPKRKLPYNAYLIHRIEPSLLQNAPYAKEVLPEFLKFINNCFIAAYNAGFDMGFLNNELRLLKCSPIEEAKVIDILELVKIHFPALASYSLSNVALQFKIANTNLHRALNDATVAAEILVKLMKVKKLALKDLTAYARYKNNKVEG